MWNEERVQCNKKGENMIKQKSISCYIFGFLQWIHADTIAVIIMVIITIIAIINVYFCWLLCCFPNKKSNLAELLMIFCWLCWSVVMAVLYCHHHCCLWPCMDLFDDCWGIVDDGGVVDDVLVVILAFWHYLISLFCHFVTLLFCHCHHCHHYYHNHYCHQCHHHHHCPWL